MRSERIPAENIPAADTAADTAARTGMAMSLAVAHLDGSFRVAPEVDRSADTRKKEVPGPAAVEHRLAAGTRDTAGPVGWLALLADRCTDTPAEAVVAASAAEDTAAAIATAGAAAATGS